MPDLRELARTMRPYIEEAAQSLPDADGLKAKALYPRWDALVKKGSVTAETGYRFTYGGELYKCVNVNPTFQADWVPGNGTAALYVRVDEAHHYGRVLIPVVAIHLPTAQVGSEVNEVLVVERVAVVELAVAHVHTRT